MSVADKSKSFGSDSSRSSRPLTQTMTQTQPTTFTELIKLEDEVHYRPSFTLPLLTKYERASVLCERATYLEENAGNPELFNPQVKFLASDRDMFQIALRELHARKLPMAVVRPLDDGSYELVAVNLLQLTEEDERMIEEAKIQNGANLSPVY